MTTFHTVSFQKTVLASLIGLCLSQSVFALENLEPLDDSALADTTGEGVAQMLFFESDEVCETSYKDRGGKYQGQTGVTLPKT